MGAPERSGPASGPDGRAARTGRGKEGRRAAAEELEVFWGSWRTEWRLDQAPGIPAATGGSAVMEDGCREFSSGLHAL